MQDFDYLARLIAERLGEPRLRGTHRDFDANFRLLQYAEAESRSELTAVRGELAAAHEQTNVARRDADAARGELAAAREQTNMVRRDADAARGGLAAAREQTNMVRRDADAARGELAAAREQTNVARRDADAARRELAAARGQTNAAHALLHNLYASTSWRLMGPMRRVVRLGRRLTAPRTALPDPQPNAAPPSVAYERATQAIIRRYMPQNAEAPPPVPLHMQLGSSLAVRREIEAARPLDGLPDPLAAPAFTIVTPYFRHEAFFGRCALSMVRLMEANPDAMQDGRLSWIVVNDDPSCSDDRLLGMIPAAFRCRVRILSDGRRHGIADALNRGVAAASDGWVLLLDCDDAIEPTAITALNAGLAAAPRCRYFSSVMIDIDDDDVELRRRWRDVGPEALFERGMVLGHLIAFRRDLFDELGGFDVRFSGVQDYDFALRAAAREPLGVLPDHLYRYRWHDNSVSVARARHQAQLADAARAAFLRDRFRLVSNAPLATSPLPDVPRGLCIIRTQGTRMGLLSAAVASVRAQAFPFTPCIVVHGDEATRSFVERRLLADGAGGPSLVVLAATETGLRRGYPCNIGLGHLKSHADNYDLLCFLDDDDHLLPCFAERLVAALRATGADFAFGLTNALPQIGEPFVQHRPLPAAALMRGNFIPIHSYVTRTDAVIATAAWFDESLDYLEDWDFLLRLVAGGAKGVPLFETVAEYRLVGDGNTEIKRDQAHFDYCINIVRERGAIAASRLPASYFWADVLDFPADRRSPLSEREFALLATARDLFPSLDTP